MKIARTRVTNELLYSEGNFFSESVFKLGFTIVRMEPLMEVNSNYAYVTAPFLNDIKQGTLTPELVIKIALTDGDGVEFSYEML